MEFTLIYRGPLPSNGNSNQKQKIRDFLHPQLKELWNHPPLNGKRQWLTPIGSPENQGFTLVEGRSGFNFVALVSNKIWLVTHLSINFLRNGPPGQLISRGGDLDNRLKTLFDALALPNEGQIREAPPSVQMPENFFCLLEDDSLIYSFTVVADRLLDGTRLHPNHLLSTDHPELEVLLLIRVVTKTTELRVLNLDL